MIDRFETMVNKIIRFGLVGTRVMFKNGNVSMPVSDHQVC